MEPVDEVNGVHREKIAKKMGFDAYGVTADAPDPVAHAINCMLDHIHVMDKRMEDMCKSLRKLSEEQPDLELPTLDSCEIASTAEELLRIHSSDHERGAKNTTPE